nr:winged helix DNA-binding domain-containing protein [Gordonia araii]
MLERQDRPALDAIEHLVGMQAQVPLAPYVGLWSRLVGFETGDLASLIENRQAVRGGAMRATIHLMSSRDFLGIRPLVQPCLDREVFQNATYGRERLEGLDVDEVLAVGEALMAQAPRTAAELREKLAPRWPDRDPAALAHAVRCLLPAIQVPPRGIWGKSGNPTMSTASLWLGRQVRAMPIDDVVLRYFAAYGPAQVRDVQAWCGLTKLGEVVDRLRPQLRAYVDDASGRELFDLAETDLPAEETLAPTRFLPEFDNLLLSHADRSRFIEDTPRGRLLIKERMSRGAVLYDGRVAALWKLHRTGGKFLEVEPVVRLSGAAREDIEREGYELLSFAVPDEDLPVRFIGS